MIAKRKRKRIDEWRVARAEEDGEIIRYEHEKGNVRYARFPYLVNADGWYAYPARSWPRGPFDRLRSAKSYIESLP